jgi:signal transduction histidine kinase
MIAVLVLLIGLAVVDLVTTAREKDQRVQESELRGQLAQFLLSIREPDGSSLLENPGEFSQAKRPLQINTLRRSFFSYLLHTGNAKTFKASEVNWEGPRACQVEFPAVREAGTPVPALQACFAAVPNDPSGRFVYFSLRYPSAKIRQHRFGQPLGDVNRVILSFAGARETRFTLAFQSPPLARARYPSQLSRFDGVHELTAFQNDDGGKPVRQVSGQAFESVVQNEGNVAKGFVTLVGRIDSAILQPTVPDTTTWPSSQVKGMKVGVKVYDVEEGGDPAYVAYDVAPGRQGTPLVSLSQAYLAAVPSRALLEVTALNADRTPRIVWRSDTAESAESPRLQGRFQHFADWLAEKALSRPRFDTAPLSAKQPLYVAGLVDAAASLRKTPVALPDLATRAFAWMSLALFVIAVLAAHWAIYIVRLLRLRAAAYSMAVRPRGGSLKPFATSRNEIGTLGRVFHALLEKNRLRNTHVLLRHRLEDARQKEGLRLAEAHVQARQAILDAIGHEIRSPLASLLTRTKDSPEVQRDLARVRRAVDALYEATSVEDGLRNGEIVISTHDVAGFAGRLAVNLRDEGQPAIYVGPPQGVLADIDTIQLEQILDNLIKNAERHRTPGTDIELQLVSSDKALTLTVFNQGAPIPEADLDRIFDLGVTGSDQPGNSGLGLFASRIYGLAMRLTLHAENRANGVALVLGFPVKQATLPAALSERATLKQGIDNVPFNSQLFPGRRPEA